MGFYDGLQKTASKLLVKFGTLLTFTRKNIGDYNPSTGGKTVVPDVIYTGYAAVMEFGAEDVNGTSILSSDVKIIAENMTQEVEVGDLVTLDSGIIYSVVYPAKTKPAGINVITTIHARLGTESVLRK